MMGIDRSRASELLRHLYEDKADDLLGYATTHLERSGRGLVCLRISAGEERLAFERAYVPLRDTEVLTYALSPLGVSGALLILEQLAQYDPRYQFVAVVHWIGMGASASTVTVAPSAVGEA